MGLPITDESTVLLRYSLYQTKLTDPEHVQAALQRLLVRRRLRHDSLSELRE